MKPSVPTSDPRSGQRVRGPTENCPQMSVMTDATTGANKTAKHSASPLGMPNYEMPKFDLPKMEMPEAFREMAEKGVAQAKDSYEKIQAAA